MYQQAGFGWPKVGVLLLEMPESIPDFHRLLSGTKPTSLLEQWSVEAGLKHLQRALDV